MPERKSSEYVCAYDVADDRERRKVERLLKGYGFRRQFSLFVCRLTRRDKSRLLVQLQKLALTSGFVLVVRIASNCRPETVGVCTMPDTDSGSAFII